MEAGLGSLGHLRLDHVLPDVLVLVGERRDGHARVGGRREAREGASAGGAGRDAGKMDEYYSTEREVWLGSLPEEHGDGVHWRRNSQLGSFEMR